MHARSLALASLCLIACGGSSPPGADVDAGPAPSGMDAGPVATADGGPTAPPPDAGTAPRDGGEPPPAVDAGEDPPMTHPIDALDALSLVILIGDSAAAGYNASGRNGEGGRAFGRLMVDNHPAYPSWSSRHLRARWPDLEFRRIAESGATSGDALSNVRDALSGELPASVPGDVLVLINVGGNDMNDSILNLIEPTRAAAVTAEVRANVAEMMRLIRERYEDSAAGQRVVFLVDDLYDPTDGTGRIPAEFDDGFCGTMHHPLLVDSIRAMALDNLAAYNAGLAEEVTAEGGHVVALSDAFLGHGMNASGERWLDDDCTHPTDEGHHGIRAAMWEVLTGDPAP